MTMDDGEIMTPSEMGKRGAKARWSRGKPRIIAKPLEAYAHRAAQKLTDQICQALQSRLRLGAAIPECLIRECVELYEREKAAGDLAGATKVLEDLTRMVVPPWPRRGSAPASPPDLRLRSLQRVQR
jgi:hypothetical protein